MRPIVRRKCDATYPDSFVPAVTEKRENRGPNFSPAIIIAAMLACVGCWEEIHYAPQADTADATSTVEPPPPAESPEPTAADEATTVNGSTATATEEQVPSALPPSSDELFAPQLPPATDEPRSELDDSESSATAADAILPTPSEAPTTDIAESGASPGSAQPAAPTSAERRLAWQAVSKWTLATAIYAKGLPRSPHAPILEEATAAAGELNIELPQLPTPAQPEDREAAVIEGLRGELAVALRNAFASRFGEEAGAAADLAASSHLLLLTYSPRDADAAMQAEGLRRAGEASGLPGDLWVPLVTLLEQRAPFLEVRQAVFDLHRGADAHLAEAASSAN